MSFRYRLFVVALVLAAAEVCGVAAHSREQEFKWHFSAEDESSYKRTEIPAAALQLISRDQGVRNLLDAQKPPQKETPRSWLSASKVYLTDRGEDDIVVQGMGPILGANVTTFWVFRVNGDNANLLLEVVAHDLIIRQPRKEGYLMVDAVSATASSVTTVSFQMNNGEYVKCREDTEKLP